jgi:threonine dehydrogenase-like Zn-dependent dehydrogenase
VLDGRIEPGRVLDRAVGLEDIAVGHQAMAERTDVKVLLRP